MLSLVAVSEAVQQHLDALIGPAAQPSGERRARNDRRIPPVIGNHQHRQALADMWPEQIDQAVDLAFEARRNVVNRREQQALRGGGHMRLSVLAEPPTPAPLTKLHLKFSSKDTL